MEWHLLLSCKFSNTSGDENAPGRQQDKETLSFIVSCASIWFPRYGIVRNAKTDDVWQTGHHSMSETTTCRSREYVDKADTYLIKKLINSPYGRPKKENTLAPNFHLRAYNNSRTKPTPITQPMMTASLLLRKLMRCTTEFIIGNLVAKSFTLLWILFMVSRWAIMCSLVSIAILICSSTNLSEL